MIKRKKEKKKKRNRERNKRKYNLGPRANFFSLFWRFNDRAQKVVSSSDFGSPALSTSFLRPSIPVNPL